MQYLLDKSEYRYLKMQSKAIKTIDKIVSERPQDDEHGNSKPYAYRFDKTISAIMDVLDEVRAAEPTVSVPWEVSR